MAPSTSTPSFSNAENLLKTFEYERTLSEGTFLSLQFLDLFRRTVPDLSLPIDPRALVVYLLGSAVPEGSEQRAPAILKVEKTPYESGEAVSLASAEAWSRLELVSTTLSLVENGD